MNFPDRMKGHLEALLIWALIAHNFSALPTTYFDPGAYDHHATIAGCICTTIDTRALHLSQSYYVFITNLDCPSTILHEFLLKSKG